MKIKNLLLLVVFGAVLLVSCNNYGDKYDAGSNIEVYYKENVDAATAKKTGDFLARNFPSDIKKSFQLTKPSEIVNFRMVVDKEKLKGVEESSFLALGMLISDSVLNGKPVNVDLCDNSFKTIKTIPYKGSN